MLVIGCAPSTGSSLLANILNRHSGILCGPETALFARMDLMMNWKQSKHLRYSKSWKKLRDYGWHRYRGVDWNQDPYPWSKDEFISIVKKSDSFLDFINNCGDIIAPNVWAEKTPSNVYAFGWIRMHYPQVKLLMMVRNPYDAIASLISRGFSVVYSVGLYLLHTSAGHFDDGSEIGICKYESLVNNPIQEIEKILNTLNLNFESSMLEPENKNIKMSGWQHDESGPISDTSIGRFEQLDGDLQDEIIQAVNTIRINPSFDVPNQRWELLTIEDICNQYDYEYRIPEGENKYRSKHRTELLLESIKRTYKGYRTHIYNFPLIYN